jgi:hypothetical protein
MKDAAVCLKSEKRILGNPARQEVFEKLGGYCLLWQVQDHVPWRCHREQTWGITVYGSHNCYTFRTIYIKDMLDNLVTPARAEICIDVGWCRSGRVEKAFEIESELQWVWTRNPQAVSNQSISPFSVIQDNT